MSSRITNVISTQFTARGGNVTATLGSMGQQTGAFMGRINEASRASERLNNQWKAIGTTMRYALAGGAVFGLAQMPAQLKEMQRQTAMIAVLSGRTADEVTRNQNVIAASAVKALTPVDEFREGLINLYSSVEKRPPINVAARLMEEISLTAQMAQTQVPEVSKAITGMLNIFGQDPNLQNVQRYTRMLTDLISTVPGGAEAGRQIMQQFPAIASPVSMARGTPAQVFGLFETLLTTGGTPAMHGRGLAFMTQTIGNLGTQTKDTQAAWREIGITPDVVQRIGVTRALLIAMDAVRRRGIQGAGTSRDQRRLSALSDESLDMLGEGTAPSTALGLTGAGAELAGRLNPRVHALREFSLLLRHEDTVKRHLRDMENDWNGSADAVKSYRENLDKLVRNQPLAAAQVALQGLRQQALLAIQPVMNLASRGIVRGAEVASAHPTGTRHALQASAGILAALGIGRFLGAGNLPGLRRLGPFSRLLGGVPQAAITAQGAHAALTGGLVLGDSPTNPMYVVLVGQLFGGGSGGKMPYTPPGQTPPVIPVTGPGRAARVARFGLRQGRRAGGFAAARGLPAYAEGLAIGGLVIAPAIAANAAAGGGESRINTLSRPRSPAEIRAAEARFPLIRGAIEGAYQGGAPLSKRYQDLLQSFMQGQITPRQYAAQLRKDTAAGGEKTLRVVIETRDDKGRVVKRVEKIPPGYWKNGAVPVLRGQAGK